MHSDGSTSSSVGQGLNSAVKGVDVSPVGGIAGVEVKDDSEDGVAIRTNEVSVVFLLGLPGEVRESSRHSLDSLLLSEVGEVVFDTSYGSRAINRGS